MTKPTLEEVRICRNHMLPWQHQATMCLDYLIELMEAEKDEWLPCRDCTFINGSPSWHRRGYFCPNSQPKFDGREEAIINEAVRRAKA